MPNCLHPFGSEPQCTESPVYRRPQIVAVIVRMRPVPRLWALPGSGLPGRVHAVLGRAASSWSFGVYLNEGIYFGL